MHKFSQREKTKIALSTTICVTTVQRESLHNPTTKTRCIMGRWRHEEVNWTRISSVQIQFRRSDGGWWAYSSGVMVGELPVQTSTPPVSPVRETRMLGCFTALDLLCRANTFYIIWWIILIILIIILILFFFVFLSAPFMCVMYSACLKAVSTEGCCIVLQINCNN